MRRILSIVRREYLETVKTRAFLISILMTPVLVAGILLLAGRAGDIMTGPAPARRIAVADLSGQVTPELERLFEQHNRYSPKRRLLASFHDADAYERDNDALEAEARSGTLDGYLVIAKDVLDGRAPSHFMTKRTSDMVLLQTIRSMLNRAVGNTRLAKHDIDHALIARLTSGVPLEQIDVSSKEKRTGKPVITMMTPFVFMFLMYMGIFVMNQHMLTSVIEEKSSRVMEVLLSSVSPMELMTGKILGLGAVGLTVIAVWSGAGYAAASIKGLTGLVSATGLTYFVIYYVLGFVLFAALFAAAGSACNSLKDAQSLVAPITFILIIPMLAWLPISQRPESTLAVVLSLAPPISPMVMVLRLAATPDVPLVQIVASILILVVVVILTMKVAAKIFRVGVLMYGKPPTLREVLRWARH